MKNLLLLTIITSFAMSGFFPETDTQAEQEAAENTRFCKVFTQKVESYKEDLREDTLAQATLKSYEERRDRFCDRVTNAS